MIAIYEAASRCGSEFSLPCWCFPCGDSQFLQEGDREGACVAEEAKRI